MLRLESAVDEDTGSSMRSALYEEASGPPVGRCPLRLWRLDFREGAFMSLSMLSSSAVGHAARPAGARERYTRDRQTGGNQPR